MVDVSLNIKRDPDGTRRILNGSGDGRPCPPGGVGRELGAAAVPELVDRLHEADVPFLYEVQELQSPVRVLLCDGYEVAEVGLRCRLFGALPEALAV